MDVTLNTKEQELLKEYKRLFDKPPEWAFEGIAPSIPYIGERFTSMTKKVLIYASAENLSSDSAHRKDLQLRSAHGQFLRSYTSRVRPNVDQNIHIEPINNGGLLKVARHILCQVDCGESFERESSKGFLSQIAVANPGKFSIDPEKSAQIRKKNYDYANQPDKF